MSINNNSKDNNKKESDNHPTDITNTSGNTQNQDPLNMNAAKPEINVANPNQIYNSYYQPYQNIDQGMNQPVYSGYYQNSIPQGFLSNPSTSPTPTNNIPINNPNPATYDQNNTSTGYYTQSPYAHLLSNSSPANPVTPNTFQNPPFYNTSNTGIQPNYPINPPQQQTVGYNIPGNFQVSSPTPNQIIYPSQIQNQGQNPINPTIVPTQNIQSFPVQTIPGDSNLEQKFIHIQPPKDNLTNSDQKALENQNTLIPIQGYSQNQIIPQINPAINYAPPMPVQNQIVIPPNLLSNPDQLYNQKYDQYFEKVLIAGNPDYFRKSLILDEPPKFFNPFVPNFGNNNLSYNPFFTSDTNLVILNMNGYLLKRFRKINLDEDLKFFSHREKKIYNLNNFMKVFLYFSIPLNIFYFMRLKSKRFLVVTFLNFLLLPYPFYIDKFVFYNSYLRNFNGYNDEQVDYILTVNSSQYQKNFSMNQNQLPYVNENNPSVKI